MNRHKLFAALQRLSPVEGLGLACAGVGIVLVALGILLQERSGVELGGTVRVMGGVLLLGGLAVALFWEPRRRAAAIGAAIRIAEGYMARTAGWDWPYRLGLAGVLIGLALLVPALVLQIIFGTIFGAVVIAPGIVLFWAGVALLAYGWFRRRRAAQTSYTPPGRSGRGRRPGADR